MANNDNPILRIKNVDIVFGRGRKEFKAVSDASFDIFKGETVSLVGESGSGKTTIGRAVVRINPVRKGYITFNNRLINGNIPPEEAQQYVAELEEELKVAENDNEPNNKIAEINAKVAELNSQLPATPVEKQPALKKEIKDLEKKAKKVAQRQAERIVEIKNAIKTINSGKITGAQIRDIVRKIQMIFQDPAASLNERATIEYIVSEGLYNFHLYDSEKERIEKVENIIKEVGLLPEHLTRYPHEFSGGQRQRVGLARSIVMEPEFIVADEPISALDVSIRAQVLNLLKKFQKERGLTYLFIAHDLSIVRFISDRIVVIHHGHIVEIAETEELFEHPLHPYTKSLMSAIPIPDPILEKQKELFVYEPDKIHDYSVNKPSLVDIGHGHFVFGNEQEIEEYKKIRG